MTLPGRLLAIVWMVASVIVVASFTAALTAQLTLKQLRGTVHGESDLRYVRVGPSQVPKRQNISAANISLIRFLLTRRPAYQRCRRVGSMQWCMTGRCSCG